MLHTRMSVGSKSPPQRAGGEVGEASGPKGRERADTDVLASAAGPITLCPLTVAPVATHLPPKVALGTRDPEEGTGGTLRSINGISVERLQATMRPGYTGLGASKAGFLGPDQTLQEVLDRDSAWLTETGHTRQALAWPLFLAVAAGRQDVDAFLFNNHIIAVEARKSRGSQQSPFHDGTRGSLKLKVTNTATGASLAFAELNPFLMHRYGFFQGAGGARDGTYRVEPGAVVSLFGLTPGTDPRYLTAELRLMREALGMEPSLIDMAPALSGDWKALARALEGNAYCRAKPGDRLVSLLSADTPSLQRVLAKDPLFVRHLPVEKREDPRLFSAIHQNRHDMQGWRALLFCGPMMKASLQQQLPLFKDPEMLCNLAKKADPEFLSWAHPSLRNSVVFAFDAAREHGLDMMPHCTPRVRKFRETNGPAFMAGDEAVILRELAEEGSLLQLAPERQRDTPRVVRVAIGNDETAINYASRAIQTLIYTFAGRQWDRTPSDYTTGYDIGVRNGATVTGGEVMAFLLDQIEAYRAALEAEPTLTPQAFWQRVSEPPFMQHIVVVSAT
jgi:hypothetical protein